MLSKEQLSEKIAKLSFEEAMQELEHIVEIMENEEASLDNSIANYEYGIALKKNLEQQLEQAKLKISKITAID